MMVRAPVCRSWAQGVGIASAVVKDMKLNDITPEVVRTAQIFWTFAMTVTSSAVTKGISKTSQSSLWFAAS